MLQRKVYILISILFITLAVTQARAETLYVTDRILLGMHQQPFEQSSIIKSIPSGTVLEVLMRQNNFAKVKTKDGTQGWVSETYLMEKQPSTAQYDVLFAQYQKSVETLKSVNEQLTKKEREVQVRRDQVSNMKTNIKELKKKLNKKTDKNAPAVNPEELQTAHTKIDELTAKIIELEQVTQTETPETASENDITKLKLENTHLHGRIELARANLAGEKVPTPEQIAGIRPSYPVWFWALFVVALVIGAVAGLGWMDYRNRQRHGGFRL